MTQLTIGLMNDSYSGNNMVVPSRPLLASPGEAELGIALYFVIFLVRDNVERPQDHESKTRPASIPSIPNADPKS